MRVAAVLGMSLIAQLTFWPAWLLIVSIAVVVWLDRAAALAYAPQRCPLLQNRVRKRPPAWSHKRLRPVVLLTKQQVP